MLEEAGHITEAEFIVPNFSRAALTVAALLPKGIASEVWSLNVRVNDPEVIVQ